MIQFFKNSIYKLLSTLSDFSLSYCYRHIISTGAPKLKNKLPTLFVSNHQNTFMDGMVLVHIARSVNPNILVRADIFKSKWAAKALDVIRLIPIYRKRDGMGSVAQNNEIFQHCISKFEKKEGVLIFPEGNHAIKRYLRTMQKGAARLAFLAEEQNDFNLGLYIIPMGLEYVNHTDRWHDLHVHFGDPVKVKDYQDMYQENPKKAIKQLTDKIEADISSEMIDIKWHDEYEFLESVRTILKPESTQIAKDKKSLVHAENEIINKIGHSLQSQPEILTSLKENVAEFEQELEKAKIAPNTFTGKKVSLGLLIKLQLQILISLPFWLIGKIFNFIPNYIIEKRVIANVKDITWHISLRSAVSMFVYPIYLGLLWMISAFIFDWVLSGILIFCLPIIFVILLETEHNLKRLLNLSRIKKHKHLAEKRKALAETILKYNL